MSGVTLITPTGDRQDTFRLCEFWVRRQTYSGPIQWIVVDDGRKLTKVSQGQEYYRRERQPDDPNHTLCRNVQIALQHAKYNRVVVIEDDDYYPPHYVETMMKWLDKSDMVGEVGAVYYFVNECQYRVFTEHEHASFCRSAFKGPALSFVRDVADKLASSQDWRLDLLMWQGWSGTKYLHRGSTHDLCISFKGMPGRVGATHTIFKHWVMQDDRDLTWIKRWLGDDYRYYLPYLRDKKINIDDLLVYTVCYGGYDNLLPQPQGVEYMAVTDQPAPAPWRTMEYPSLFDSPRRSSRRPKILAHELFPGRTTLYIDANMRLKTDPRELAEEFVRSCPASSLFLFRHQDRDDVLAEANVVIQMGLDDANTVRDYMELRYRGVDTKMLGLAAGGCILRLPGCERFNETWWQEYEAGPLRDQLSMPYALLESGITYSLMPNPFHDRRTQETRWVHLSRHRQPRMAMETV